MKKKEKALVVQGCVWAPSYIKVTEGLESDQVRLRCSTKDIHHLLSSWCLIYSKPCLHSLPRPVETGLGTNTVFNLLLLPLSQEWSSDPLNGAIAFLPTNNVLPAPASLCNTSNHKDRQSLGPGWQHYHNQGRSGDRYSISRLEKHISARRGLAGVCRAPGEGFTTAFNLHALKSGRPVFHLARSNNMRNTGVWSAALTSFEDLAKLKVVQ